VWSGFEVLIQRKEVFVVEVSYRCLRRGEVSLLGKEARLAGRINPRR
jgi:hypothetical protein